LSSLAVVDPSGKLIGNFSLSDLRSINSEQFGALALPVGEFLALEHRVSGGRDAWRIMKPFAQSILLWSPDGICPTQSDSCGGARCHGGTWVQVSRMVCL